MQQKIIHYLKAAYPALFVLTHEETRAEAEILGAVERLNQEKPDKPFTLYFWSLTTGIAKHGTGETIQADGPEAALQAFMSLPERSVLILRDFQQFWKDENPLIIRLIKDAVRLGKGTNRTLIVTGCRLNLPPELEKELTPIEFDLPGRYQLKAMLAELGQSGFVVQDLDRVLDAAGGMTTVEAENAFALAQVTMGHVDPSIVQSEKANALKKNGLLELIKTSACLESIGGLENLKAWLLKRRQAFSTEAKEYGIPTPKGFLMVGIPGSGKSLTAKACAAILKVPLLKLDAGKLFGSLVGESERNLRTAIQTAEAIAPCVLWMDEIEKGLSGSKSSGATDGGTSARVFGTFLQWLQEKTSPVFVVATANDVSALPPEFLRAGRWDKLFFVDLPDQDERRSIWGIQIRKWKRDPQDYDIDALAKLSEGWTGSEIETAYCEALYQGFDDGRREPTDFSLAQVATQLVPLSQTMKGEIEQLRAWAKGRATRANAPQGQTPITRKLAA